MRRDVFQAIADPRRRAILHLLALQTLTLNGVAEHFKISRPAISKHVKILSECGLVKIKQEGRERYVTAQLGKLNEVSDWVEQYRKFWESKLDALEEYLQELQSKGNTHDKKKNETIASVAPKEVIITRIINAPRELVFEAYTNPEHVAKWFGPRIFTAIAEAELRTGGKYRYTMIGTEQAPPELKGPYPMKGEYLEFIRPVKIVQTIDLTEQPDDWKEFIKSNIAGYNGQDFLHSQTTVTFEEMGSDQTKITISEKFDSDEVRDAYFKTGMKEGWAESMGKLEELLESR